jgi:hypothetical protein
MLGNQAAKPDKPNTKQAQPGGVIDYQILGTLNMKQVKCELCDNENVMNT